MFLIIATCLRTTGWSQGEGDRWKGERWIWLLVSTLGNLDRELEATWVMVFLGRGWKGFGWGFDFSEFWIDDTDEFYIFEVFYGCMEDSLVIEYLITLA